MSRSRPATVRCQIPDSLWAELRHAAVERRVTVKYLVLEALAGKGYEVDLSAIPEDGRRNR